MRSSGLMYVLSGIVLLNIIAIVLLSRNLPAAGEPTVQQEGYHAVPPNSFEQPNVIEVSAPQPLVRTLVLQDPHNCPDCFDILRYAEELQDMINMSIENADLGVIDTSRLPALAFNQTIEQYPESFVQGWERYGETVTIADGKYSGTWYILPTLNPPYLDTMSNLVKGRVTATYVTLERCSECYDVFMNREFMRESRITPYHEIIVDADSPQGKILIDRYAIDAVPTLFMSPEAGEYTNLKPGWPMVGTIESDGTFVLRNLQRLGVTYYDLNSNQVLAP